MAHGEPTMALLALFASSSPYDNGVKWVGSESFHIPRQKKFVGTCHSEFPSTCVHNSTHMSAVLAYVNGILLRVTRRKIAI